jgi:hypothetical protein
MQLDNKPHDITQELHSDIKFWNVEITMIVVGILVAGYNTRMVSRGILIVVVLIVVHRGLEQLMRFDEGRSWHCVE